jgi:hypothetical protein
VQVEGFHRWKFTSTVDAHAPIQALESPSEWEILEIAVRELAIARGLFSADDHRRFLVDGRSDAGTRRSSRRCPQREQMVPRDAKTLRK